MKLTPEDLPALRPLLAEIVRETLAQSQANGANLGDRLGFPEAEAAALLGLPKHVLRDCRLRGEISARRVGCRFVYSRGELSRFLADS